MEVGEAGEGFVEAFLEDGLEVGEGWFEFVGVGFDEGGEGWQGRYGVGFFVVFGWWNDGG